MQFTDDVNNSSNFRPNNMTRSERHSQPEAVAQQQFRYKSSYANPASITLAKKHQTATKYGYKPKPIQRDHRKARQLERENICGCCNLSAHNEQIPILESVQPVRNAEFKLTEDVALYFTFIKSLILFIVLHTIIHSAFNVISSATAGSFCDRLNNCEKAFWNKTSISNKYDRQDLIFVVNILDLVAIFVSILFLGWSRRYFYRVSQDIDLNSVSQADFTLFISNIPRMEYPDTYQNALHTESTSREQLKVFLESFITEGIRTGQINVDGRNLESYILKRNDARNSPSIIRSISLCYNLNELQILHNEKWDLIWGFQNNFILLNFLGIQIPDLFGFKIPLNYEGQANSLNSVMRDEIKSPKKQPKSQNFMRRFETNLNEEVDYNLLDVNKRNQLNETRRKVNFICESQIAMGNELVKNNKLFFHNVNFSGKSFVSFEFEDFKDYIYQSYLTNPNRFVLNGEQLKIEEACDPIDVKWYNMKISQSSRSNKIFFSYIVLVMLLMFSFMLLFSVEILKRNYTQSKEGGVLSFAKTQGLSLITSLIILGANSLFDFVSGYLTELQGHTTKTNEMFSHVIKSFFSRLINTVFMYLVIAVILTRDTEQKFLTSAGLVTQIFNFIVVSGLKNLLDAFINKDDILARIKRWFIYSYRQSSDQVFTKFQITLNQEFELPDFNLVYKYNDYLVTLYTAFFYAYLVPIVIPTLIVIFSVQYWIDKFTLFKRSSMKNHFNYNLSIYVRKIFESSVFIFALGNFVFSYFQQDYQTSSLSLIGLILAFFYTICIWIAPYQVERKLFGEYEAIDTISYSECLNDYKFKATYWNQNPATFCVNQSLQMSKHSLTSPQKSRKSIEEIF